jgi:hypothetical protein
MKRAHTGPSPMWKQIQREEARKLSGESAPASAPAPGPGADMAQGA